MLPPLTITLRPTVASDVPMLHALELDPEANAMAGTKPRDWATFKSRWDEILADPDGHATRVTPRVVEADGVVVGAINIAPHDGRDSIGYWIAREHWGRGIASRAVVLMLRECSMRPLYASASAQNAPSLRVLHKSGFVHLSRAWTQDTCRTVARETITLVLPA